MGALDHPAAASGIPSVSTATERFNPCLRRSVVAEQVWSAMRPGPANLRHDAVIGWLRGAGFSTSSSTDGLQRAHRYAR